MPKQPPGLSAHKFAGQHVARNASRSLLGQIIPILVALVSIPLLIHRLGTDRFGVLTLAWAFMGYFNLFDLGLGRTLTKNIAERIGSENEHEIPGLFWTILTSTCALGILGGIVLAIFSPWLVNHVFNIPLDLREETLDSLLIISCCVPFVIMTVPFKGVLEATQDFVTINRIQVPLGALFYFAPLLFSFVKLSLPFVILALVLCRFFSWLFFCIAALKALPQSGYSKAPQWKLLPPLIKFGGWLTVANVTKPILNYADRFMIDILISISAVAYYATSYEITNRMWILPWAVMSAIFPAFAYQVKAAPDEAAILFRRALRLLFLILLPVTFTIVLYAHDILLIWVGPEYADHAGVVFQVLAIATFMNCLSLIPEALLEAIGHPEIPGILHLVQLPLYIFALYIVLPRFGLVGAGVVWVVHTTLDTVTLMIFAQRKLPSIQFNLKRIAVVMFFCAASFSLFFFVHPPLIERIIIGGLFVAIYPTVVWFTILTTDEREFILSIIKSRTPSLDRETTG